MPGFTEHGPQWMPQKALHGGSVLSPDALVTDELPDVLNELVEHYLISGTPEVNDYIGYPDVQRSVAEEMALAHLARSELIKTTDPVSDNASIKTHYIASSEPLLFYAARTYGTEAVKFREAVDSFELTDHVAAIKKAIDSPSFRQSESSVAIRAIEALTAIVRERADDAETLAGLVPVDSFA